MAPVKKKDSRGTKGPSHGGSNVGYDDHRPNEFSEETQGAQQKQIEGHIRRLYNVYNNTIEVIQELEKHEKRDGKQIRKVTERIEFESLKAQMKSLPPEVTNAAKKDLVMQTIGWAASRQAQGISLGHVDHYCANVLKILLDAPNVASKFTTEQVNEAMRQMAVQRQDPMKEAKLRNKRQAEDLRQGALRLAKYDPSLTSFLEEQGYIPYEKMEIGGDHDHQDDPHLPGYSCHKEVKNYHGPQQAQSQIALHRTIQASYQMLYDVYDYTIGMIEELEKYETHGKQIQNSGILSHAIPVDYKKPIHDVIGGIELELKCLQAQMKSLPSDVTRKAEKDLVMQTLRWAASREAQGIPLGHVDHYCANVLEILLFDAPKKLPDVDRAPKIEFTTEQVNEAMYQMAAQRHLGEKQDEEFARDATKEAKLRYKKQAGELRQGAKRLEKFNPRLLHELEKRNYVPDAKAEIR